MIRIDSLGLVAPYGSVIGLIGIAPAPSGDFRVVDNLPSLDAIAKALAITDLLEERRAGKSILLRTDDERILTQCADEVWWITAAGLMARGAPEDVLARYNKHVAAELRAAASGRLAPLSIARRDGDGRAVLLSIELLDRAGTPVTAWTSGETATIRVTVRFSAEVADPVIGILIRTRIGLNVYGTNTELEGLRFGPVASGTTSQISFEFACNLCAGDYTLTAASHDPDGVWHDWLDDAVAFAVRDQRYTAGVANLRASVSVTPQS